MRGAVVVLCGSIASIASSPTPVDQETVVGAEATQSVSLAGDEPVVVRASVSMNAFTFTEALLELTIHPTVSNGGVLAAYAYGAAGSVALGEVPDLVGSDYDTAASIELFADCLGDCANEEVDIVLRRDPSAPDPTPLELRVVPSLVYPGDAPDDTSIAVTLSTP